MRTLTSSWIGALAMLGGLSSGEASGERGRAADVAEVSLLGCSEAGQRWRGFTRAGSLTLTEDVTLDAAGHLVRAETRALDPVTHTDVRTYYDRATSSVVVASGGVTRLHVIEGGGPWVYGAVTTHAGAIPTRLAALVLYRAGHDAAAVRLVYAARGTSVRVPTDQVLVETERGLVAVLGDSAFVIGELDEVEPLDDPAAQRSASGSTRIDGVVAASSPSRAATTPNAK